MHMHIPEFLRRTIMFSKPAATSPVVQREIFFNISLPERVLDAEGNPVLKYPRNKVRTARYTPLGFIPKNLWLQFHNIANVYFLFVTILAIFPIFGATNPALGSVPLIVILLITGIKDAIEDYRRTVLDNELNNSPVDILSNWKNPNCTDDSVTVWRRVKKATTRLLTSLWKACKPIKKYPGTESGSGRRDSLGSMMSRNSDLIPMDTVNNGNRQDCTISCHSESGVKGDASPKRQWASKPHFKKGLWKDVTVGDVLRLYNDDEVPADVVVLSTSGSDGLCFVETKNLDGETNLKIRNALSWEVPLTHAADLSQLRFSIESESPHANLYSYNGSIKLRPELENSPASTGESVSMRNMLLRGTTLRNTKWVIGLVIFTGDETKIMMNSGITPSKRSRITRNLNWNVLVNFAILLALCFVSGVVQGVTWGRGAESLVFFEYGSIGGSPPIDGLVTFWTSVILFQNLVPISLYISLEIIKLAQAYFIYSDVEMYSPDIDYPCTPKSWSISDDLGQIEYIFSDKTGTLTRNVMEFKGCSISGEIYAHQGAPNSYEANSPGNQGSTGGALASLSVKNPYFAAASLTFYNEALLAVLGSQHDFENEPAKYFFLCLALCNTVLPDRKEIDGVLSLSFKAESPDESALVSMASNFGFSLISRSQTYLQLDVMGQEMRFPILAILEFNSARKRMSMIVRFPDEGIRLICKGADSAIFSRLRKGNEGGMRRQTALHLEQFARTGLRTLCIATRILTEAEFREWYKEYQSALSSVRDREARVEEVAERIEMDLDLLGGTAIEDRLQDGVPETISTLATAGIKLWVLTGDKVETAINIGFSCHLLREDMNMIVITHPDVQGKTAEVLISSLLLDNFAIRADSSAPVIADTETTTNALIIDGEALKLCLEDSVRDSFLTLCKHCNAVLCCRVSPSQKAAVVQMVKSGLGVMTLAIGDGANDVAMIQEADVGIGIAGVEGRQAVMSSDYAIGQFRFLTRLLLVHGRWSYRRLAETIANFFYKNIVWTFALFWYQIFNNFDGTYLFEYTYILLYNLAFTSLPVILLGILDQDVSASVSVAVPQLYRRGILQKEWTPLKFWLYMLDGCYQSLTCYFTTYLLFRNGGFVTGTGLALNGREQMGVYIACASVCVVNLYILINQFRWDWLSVMVIVASTLLVWIWTAIYSQFSSTGAFYRSVENVFAAASFWATVFLTVTISLLPRVTAKILQKVYYPRDIDIIREQSLGGIVIRSSSGVAPETHSKRTLVTNDEEIPIVNHRYGSSGSTATGEDNPAHHYGRCDSPATSRHPRMSIETREEFTSAAMLERIESTRSRNF